MGAPTGGWGAWGWSGGSGGGGGDANSYGPPGTVPPPSSGGQAQIAAADAAVGYTGRGAYAVGGNTYAYGGNVPGGPNAGPGASAAYFATLYEGRGPASGQGADQPQGTPRWSQTPAGTFTPANTPGVGGVRTTGQEISGQARWGGAGIQPAWSQQMLGVAKDLGYQPASPLQAMMAPQIPMFRTNAPPPAPPIPENVMRDWDYAQKTGLLGVYGLPVRETDTDRSQYAERALLAATYREYGNVMPASIQKALESGRSLVMTDTGWQFGGKVGEIGALVMEGPDAGKIQTKDGLITPPTIDSARALQGINTTMLNEAMRIAHENQLSKSGETTAAGVLKGQGYTNASVIVGGAAMANRIYAEGQLLKDVQRVNEIKATHPNITNEQVVAILTSQQKAESIDAYLQGLPLVPSDSNFMLNNLPKLKEAGSVTYDVRTPKGMKAFTSAVERSVNGASGFAIEGNELGLKGQVFGAGIGDFALNHSPSMAIYKSGGIAIVSRNPSDPLGGLQVWDAELDGKIMPWSEFNQRYPNLGLTTKVDIKPLPILAALPEIFEKSDKKTLNQIIESNIQKQLDAGLINESQAKQFREYTNEMMGYNGEVYTFNKGQVTSVKLPSGKTLNLQQLQDMYPNLPKTPIEAVQKTFSIATKEDLQKALASLPPVKLPPSEKDETAIATRLEGSGLPILAPAIGNVFEPLIKDTGKFFDNLGKTLELMSAGYIDVKIPEPRSYSANDKIDTNDPSNMMTLFYQKYNVPIELQKQIKDSGIKVRIQRTYPGAFGTTIMAPTTAYGAENAYNYNVGKLLTQLIFGISAPGIILSSINTPEGVADTLVHELGHVVFRSAMGGMRQREWLDAVGSVKNSEEEKQKMTGYMSTGAEVKFPISLVDDKTFMDESYAEFFRYAMTGKDGYYGLRFENLDKESLDKLSAFLPQSVSSKSIQEANPSSRVEPSIEYKLFAHQRELEQAISTESGGKVRYDPITGKAYDTTTGKEIAAAEVGRVEIKAPEVTGLSSPITPPERGEVSLFSTPAFADEGAIQAKLIKNMDGKGEGLFYQVAGKKEDGTNGLFSYYLVRQLGDEGRLKADPLAVWIKSPDGGWVSRSIGSLSHCSATECGTETSGYLIGVNYLNQRGWPDAYDSPTQIYNRPGGFVFSKYDTTSYNDEFQTTPDALLKEIPTNKGVTILQFGYEGCQGCEQQMGNINKLMRDQYGFNNPNLHYYYIDTNSPDGDKLTGNGGKFETMSVPYTVIYVDGVEKQRKKGAMIPAEITYLLDERYPVTPYKGEGSKGEFKGQPPPAPIPPPPVPPTPKEAESATVSFVPPPFFIQGRDEILYIAPDGKAIGFKSDEHNYNVERTNIQGVEAWQVCVGGGCRTDSRTATLEQLMQSIHDGKFIPKPTEYMGQVVPAQELDFAPYVKDYSMQPVTKTLWDRQGKEGKVVAEDLSKAIIPPQLGKEMPIQPPQGVAQRPALARITEGEAVPVPVPKPIIPPTLPIPIPPSPLPVIISPVSDSDVSKYTQNKADFDSKVKSGIWVTDPTNIFAGYDKEGKPFVITPKQYADLSVDQKAAFDRGGVAGLQALVTQQRQALAELDSYRTTSTAQRKGMEMMPADMVLGGTLFTNTYNIVKYAQEVRNNGKSASQIQQTLHDAGFKDEKIAEVMKTIPPDKYLSDKDFNTLSNDDYAPYARMNPDDPRVKYTPKSMTSPPSSEQYGVGAKLPQTGSAYRTWIEANRNVQFEGKPRTAAAVGTYLGSVWNDQYAQLNDWVEKSKEVFGKPVPLSVELSKVFPNVQGMPKITIANDPAIMKGLLLNPSIRIGSDESGVQVSGRGLSFGAKPPTEAEQTGTALEILQGLHEGIGKVIPHLGTQEQLDTWFDQAKSNRIKELMYEKSVSSITPTDKPKLTQAEAEKIYNENNSDMFYANVLRSTAELVRTLPEIPLIIAQDFDQLAEGDKAKLMDVVATAGGIILAIPAMVGQAANVMGAGQSSKAYGMAVGGIGSMLISPQAIYRGIRGGALDLYSAVRGLSGKEFMSRGMAERTDIAYAPIPQVFQAEEAVTKAKLADIYTKPVEQQRAEIRETLNPENKAVYDGALHAIDELSQVDIPMGKVPTTVELNKMVKTLPNEQGAIAVKAVLQKYGREARVEGSTMDNVFSGAYKAGDMDIVVPDNWTNQMKRDLAKELADAYVSGSGDLYRAVNGKVFTNIFDPVIGKSEKAIEIHNETQFKNRQRILGFENKINRDPIMIDGIAFGDIRNQLYRRGREVIRPGINERTGMMGVGESGAEHAGRIKDTERFVIVANFLLDNVKDPILKAQLALEIKSIFTASRGDPRPVDGSTINDFINKYAQPAQEATLRAALENKPITTSIAIPKESQAMVDALANIYGLPSGITQFRISSELARAQGLYKEKVIGGRVVAQEINISKLNKYLKSEQGQFAVILHELVHNSKLDENAELIGKIGKIIDEAKQKTGDSIENPWQSGSPIEIAVSEVVTDLYAGKLLGTQANKGYPLTKLHDHIAKTYGEVDSAFGTRIADRVINEIKSYVNALPRVESMPTIDRLGHTLREAGVNVTDSTKKFASVVGKEGTLRRELSPMEQRQPYTIYTVIRDGTPYLEAAKAHRPVVSGFVYDRAGNLVKAEGAEIYYSSQAAFDRYYNIKEGTKGANTIIIATQMMPDDIGTVFRQNTKTELLRQSKNFTIQTPLGDLTPGGFITMEVWPDEMALTNGSKIYFQINAKGEPVRFDARHPETRDKIPIYFTTTERGLQAGLKPPDAKLVSQVALDALKAKFADLKNVHLTKKIVVNKDYNPIGRRGLLAFYKETPYEFKGSKTILPKSTLLEKGVDSLKNKIDGIILTQEGVQVKAFEPRGRVEGVREITPRPMVPYVDAAIGKGERLQTGEMVDVPVAFLYSPKTGKVYTTRDYYTSMIFKDAKSKAEAFRKLKDGVGGNGIVIKAETGDVGFSHDEFFGGLLKDKSLLESEIGSYDDLVRGEIRLRQPADQLAVIKKTYRDKEYQYLYDNLQARHPEVQVKYIDQLVRNQIDDMHVKVPNKIRDILDNDRLELVRSKEYSAIRDAAKQAESDLGKGNAFISVVFDPDGVLKYTDQQRINRIQEAINKLVDDGVPLDTNLQVGFPSAVKEGKYLGEYIKAKTIREALGTETTKGFKPIGKKGTEIVPNVKHYDKLSDAVSEFPPIPPDYVRVEHQTGKSEAQSIKNTGFTYIGGLDNTTWRIIKGDIRDALASIQHGYSGDYSVIMDIPRDVYEKAVGGKPSTQTERGIPLKVRRSSESFTGHAGNLPPEYVAAVIDIKGKNVEYIPSKNVKIPSNYKEILQKQLDELNKEKSSDYELQKVREYAEGVDKNGNLTKYTLNDLLPSAIAREREFYVPAIEYYKNQISQSKQRLTETKGNQVLQETYKKHIDMDTERLNELNKELSKLPSTDAKPLQVRDIVDIDYDIKDIKDRLNNYDTYYKTQVEKVLNLGDLRDKSKRTEATNIVKETIREEEKARTGKNKLSDKEVDRVANEYVDSITRYVEPYAKIDIQPKPTIVTPKEGKVELTSPITTTVPSLIPVPTKKEPIISPVITEKTKETTIIATEKAGKGGIPTPSIIIKTIPTTGITTQIKTDKITTTIPVKKEITDTIPITTKTTPVTTTQITHNPIKDTIIIHTKKGNVELKKEQFMHAIAWKQGELHGKPLYKFWYQPYGQKDLINTLEPIQDVPYKEGIRSAYESAVVLFGGEIPEGIKRTMGVVNISAFRSPDKTKPILHFDENYNKPKTQRHSHKELPRSASLGSVRV
jgi:hypothetical protein